MRILDCFSIQTVGTVGIHEYVTHYHSAHESCLLCLRLWKDYQRPRKQGFAKAKTGSQYEVLLYTKYPHVGNIDVLKRKTKKLVKA